MHKARTNRHLSQNKLKYIVTLCPKIGPKDDGSQSPPSLFVHRQTQLLSESLVLRFCLVVIIKSTFGTQYLLSDQLKLKALNV